MARASCYAESHKDGDPVWVTCGKGWNEATVIKDWDGDWDKLIYVRISEGGDYREFWQAPAYIRIRIPGYDALTVKLPDGREFLVHHRNRTPADPTKAEFAPLPPEVAEYFEVRYVAAPFLIRKGQEEPEGQQGLLRRWLRLIREPSSEDVHLLEQQTAEAVGESQDEPCGVPR